MKEVMDIISSAIEKWKDDYGELSDGDEFVVVLNNCILLVSKKDGNLVTHFIDGKPYYLDSSLSIYEEQE